MTVPHPHWNKHDAHRSGISEWCYRRYGYSWPEWRDNLLRIGRLRGWAIRHGFRTDSLTCTDAAERQLRIALRRHPHDHTPDEISVLELVGNLPEPKRTAIKMWSEGYTHREIANEMRWAEEYSRHAIGRIIDHLRSLF